MEPVMNCPTGRCPLEPVCPLNICPQVETCPHLYSDCEEPVCENLCEEDFIEDLPCDPCDGGLFSQYDLGQPRLGRGRRGRGGGPRQRGGAGMVRSAPVVTTRPAIPGGGGGALLPRTVGGAGTVTRTMPLLGRGGRGRQRLFPTGGRSGLFQGRHWFPRLFGGLWGLWRYRWFAPFYQYYAPYWYPEQWAPLYVYNDAGLYVRNPDLASLTRMPDMVLPCFQVDLGLLRYEQQSLLPEQRAQVERILGEINQQLQLLKMEMQYNPSYVYWKNRGFEIVPDLDRGCFAWAYTRPDVQPYGFRCPKHESKKEKELALLTNEKILFDVYSEENPFAGHFISDDGDVYAYMIDYQGSGDEARKTTFVDKLPTTVPLSEIERLKDMLRAAKSAQVNHFRHDTGDLRYWGFLGDERMFIYGDGNSQSAESDALIDAIDRILFPAETSSSSSSSAGQANLTVSL